jgi:hypothetical protein
MSLFIYTKLRPQHAIAQHSEAASRLFLVGITLLGFALFIHASGRQPFWLDEAVTVVGSSTWKEFFPYWNSPESKRYWAHHLIVYGLAQFNGTEFWLRLYSVFFATLTVPIAAILGRHVTNRNFGLATGLLVLVSGLVRHAQEARMYSMHAFFGALLLYAYFRAMQARSWKQWSLYSLVCLFGIWNHLFIVLSIASHAVAALGESKTRRQLPALIGSALFASAVAFFSFGSNRLEILSSASIQTSWIIKPTLNSIVSHANYVTGHSRQWWFFAPIVILAMVTIVITRVKQRTYAWKMLATFSALAFPITSAYWYSLTRQSLFLDRYLILDLVPASMIAMIAICALRNRLIIAAVLMLYMLSPVLNMRAYYERTYSEDWRSISQFIIRQAQPNDAIAFLPSYMHYPYRAYAEKFDTNAYITRITHKELLDVNTLVAAHPRVWLVTTGYPPDTDPQVVRNALATRYSLVTEKGLVGGQVTLFTKSP